MHFYCAYLSLALVYITALKCSFLLLLLALFIATEHVKRFIEICFCMWLHVSSVTFRFE
jgi:hypothetical protein